MLSDATANIHADGFQLDARDLGIEAPFSIEFETLKGGKQAGVDLVTVRTDELVLRVLPTRGMSILDVHCGDVRLGWDSPSHEIVHPALIDLESRGGLGWLEGFNELLVRCGLEFAGHPGQDEFTNNEHLVEMRTEY